MRVHARRGPVKLAPMEGGDSAVRPAITNTLDLDALSLSPREPASASGLPPNGEDVRPHHGLAQIK